MTNAECKAMCLRAMANSMGDDLERARSAFRGLSSAEMGHQYGQSGRTRQEIITEYEIDRAKRTEALAWLERQPT